MVNYSTLYSHIFVSFNQSIENHTIGSNIDSATTLQQPDAIPDISQDRSLHKDNVAPWSILIILVGAILLTLFVNLVKFSTRKDTYCDDDSQSNWSTHEAKLQTEVNAGFEEDIQGEDMPIYYKSNSYQNNFSNREL